MAGLIFDRAFLDINFWEVSDQRPLSFSMHRISLALGNLRDESILSLH